MNELDVVALKRDRLDLGLKAGEFGTIVMKFNEMHILVEFSDDDGQEYAMPTLQTDEVVVIWTREDGDIKSPVSLVKRAAG